MRQGENVKRNPIEQAEERGVWERDRQRREHERARRLRRLEQSKARRGNKLRRVRK